jgi:hypothetical protein
MSPQFGSEVVLAVSNGRLTAAGYLWGIAYYFSGSSVILPIVEVAET